MPARYTQAIAAFRADASKTLVNARCNEVVNIPSTKMMKNFSSPYRYGTIASEGATLCHGRACPGQPPSSLSAKYQDVDARDKPGHDEVPVDRHCERSEAIDIPATEIWIASSLALLAMTMVESTPGWRSSCRARPARRRDGRSARDRASTRRSLGRSRGRTRRRRDRRHARRRCRPSDRAASCVRV